MTGRRRHKLRFLAAAVGALILVGACGQPGPAEPATARVLDPDGVIVDWRFRFFPEFTGGEVQLDSQVDQVRDNGSGRLSLDIGVYAPPDGWDLRVAWSALSCQRAPVVQVRSDRGVITAVTVDTGPDVGSDPAAKPPVICPLMAVHHAVDLRTEAPLAPDLVVAQISDGALGALQDWTVHADLPAPGSTGPLLLDPPGGWDLRVAWAASPCQRRPSLSLEAPERGDEPWKLGAIGIDPGPHLDPGSRLDPGSCDTTVWYAADVKTLQEAAAEVSLRQWPEDG